MSILKISIQRSILLLHIIPSVAAIIHICRAGGADVIDMFSVGEVSTDVHVTAEVFKTMNLVNQFCVTDETADITMVVVKIQ